MKIDANEILKEIRRLEKRQIFIKSFTEYSYLMSDIGRLAHIYMELGGEDINIDYYFITQYEKLMLKKEDVYFEPINHYLLHRNAVNKTMSNLLNEYEDSKFVYYGIDKSTKTFSEKEFLEIMRCFLNDYDTRLYKTFESARKEGLIDIDTKNKSVLGETCFTFTNEKSYILMESRRDIYGLEILAHEMGHFYSFQQLYNRSKKQICNFSMSFYEMYSLFLEMQFYNFMKKNYISMRNTIACENANYNMYKAILQGLYECKDLNVSKNDYDALARIKNNYIYGYDFAIALQMHERYLEDPNETKKILDNFIFTSGLIDRDAQLEVLGLSEEDIQDGKVLRKKLEKHNEDMKKYVVRQKI